MTARLSTAQPSALGPTDEADRAATTPAPDSARSIVEALIAGFDASLVVMVLGIIYSVIVYSGFGAAALPFALTTTTIALLAGGLGTFSVARTPLLINGPTASGVLVIASMVRELQDLPAARGDFEATIVATAAATLLAALAQLAFGRLRVGTLLKFVPYPVLMGFGNTVALLLVVNMLPAALGHAYSGHIVDLPKWFVDWRPLALCVAVAGTAGGFAAARWVRRVPPAFVALVCATVVQYLIGAGCDDCRLGPSIATSSTSSAGWPRLSHFTIVADQGLSFWSIVLQAAVTLAILNSLFSLLSAAQLSHPRDPPIDGNRLLHGLGIGNLWSGALLGLPVSGLASPTQAVRRATARPWFAVGVYFVSVLVIFSIGRRWFSALPMAGIAAALFVNSRNLFDDATRPLLRQSFGDSSTRKATYGPLAVATLVVVVGLFKGMAAALFAGALAAACLLAIEMRRSVVLAMHDASTHRSRRVRTDADAERLEAAADRIQIVVLGHWLYFGTADTLADLLDRPSNARWLVLDLREVAGIDLTAARSLARAAERLAMRGIRLVATGLPEHDPRRAVLTLFRDEVGRLPMTLVATLDEALEAIEDVLLGGDLEATTGPVSSPRPALSGLSDDEADRLHARLEAVPVAAREALFRAGDEGDALFIVASGRMTLWVDRPGGTRHRLLTFGAQAIFGELALLDRRPRSADAVADVDTLLWRLRRADLDALATTDARLHAAVLNAIALHLAQRLRDVTRLLDLG